MHTLIFPLRLSRQGNKKPCRGVSIRQTGEYDNSASLLFQVVKSIEVRSLLSTTQAQNIHCLRGKIANPFFETGCIPCHRHKSSKFSWRDGAGFSGT